MPYLSTQHLLKYFSTSLYVPVPATVDIPMSIDTFLFLPNPTTNFVTNTNLGTGESNAGSGYTVRSLIKPDFSSIPAGATFTAATLYLTPVADYSSNARTMYCHRVLQAVVYAEATWNKFSTAGGNWATAGCSHSSTDYDGAVTMGSMAQAASPTLNVALPMTLLHADLQKLYDGTYTNNGLVLFVDTQANDEIDYASLEHATSAYRPKITITYAF